jgi:hypothetical protein
MSMVRLRAIPQRRPSWPSRGRDRGSCANRGKRYLDRERPRQMQQRLLGHDNAPGQLPDPRRRPRQLPLHRRSEPLSIVDPRRDGHFRPADDRQFQPGQELTHHANPIRPRSSADGIR